MLQLTFKAKGFIQLLEVTLKEVGHLVCRNVRQVVNTKVLGSRELGGLLLLVRWNNIQEGVGHRKRPHQAQGMPRWGPGS